MNIASSFYTPGIGFLLTLLFGFWLSRRGKPYNSILFNVHKLAALGAVVLTGMQVYGLLPTLEPGAPIILLLMVAGMGVVALFASGAFMSIGNANYRVMKTVHNVAPVLVVAALWMAVYLGA
jgi:hypothetical protein